MEASQTVETLYHVGRPKGRVQVYVTRTDGEVRGRELLPDASQKLYNHSPDGFEFGYQGSGPAQLALAILYDFTEDKDLALEHYQDFKVAFIAGMPHGGRTIHGDDISLWLRAQAVPNVR